MELDKLIETLRLLSNEDTKKLLEKIEESGDLTNFLFTLSKDKRERIVKKLKSFAECDSKDDDIVDGKYNPYFKRFDFVHVKFTGVGYEWDGDHYAVIWNDNPKLEQVVVIPTTSQPREERPDIIPLGKVLGLPRGKDTTLLVSDITRVSRRRLTPVTFNHFKRGRINSRVKPNHFNRIEQAIAISIGNEHTFETYLKFNTGVAMPEDLSPLYAWRYIPIKGEYNEADLLFKYRIYNSSEWHELKMVLPNERMSKDDKKGIIEGLFSLNDDIRQSAELSYKKLFTTKDQDQNEENSNENEEI